MLSFVERVQQLIKQPVPQDMEWALDIEQWNAHFSDTDALDTACRLAGRFDCPSVLTAVLTYVGQHNPQRTESVFSQAWFCAMEGQAQCCLSHLCQWFKHNTPAPETIYDTDRFQELFFDLVQRGMLDVATAEFDARSAWNPATLIEHILELSLCWEHKVQLLQNLVDKGIGLSAVEYNNAVFYPVLQTFSPITDEQWMDLFCLGLDPRVIPTSDLMPSELQRFEQIQQQYNAVQRQTLMAQIHPTPFPARKKKI